MPLKSFGGRVDMKNRVRMKALVRADETRVDKKKAASCGVDYILSFRAHWRVHAHASRAHTQGTPIFARFG